MDHLNFSLVLPAGTVAVGTTTYIMGKAPADAYGGGLTILEGYTEASAVLAAGSALNVTFVTLDSTSTVSGTIGATGAGSAWTAGTARALTVSDGRVDGGEYIAAVVVGTAVNATSHVLALGLNAVMGR